MADAVLPSQVLRAEVAVRLMGWNWWLDKERNLFALYPPNKENYIWWNFLETKFEKFDGTPPMEQWFTDWYRLSSLNTIKGFEDGLPHFESDHNAKHMILEEVQRRGLRKFRNSLYRCVKKKGVVYWASDEDFWLNIMATPEEVCRAALMALDRESE